MCASIRAIIYAHPGITITGSTHAIIIRIILYMGLDIRGKYIPHTRRHDEVCPWVAGTRVRYPLGRNALFYASRFCKSFEKFFSCHFFVCLVVLSFACQSNYVVLHTIFACLFYQQWLICGAKITLFSDICKFFAKKMQINCNFYHFIVFFKL